MNADGFVLVTVVGEGRRSVSLTFNIESDGDIVHGGDDAAFWVLEPEALISVSAEMAPQAATGCWTAVGGPLSASEVAYLIVVANGKTWMSVLAPSHTATWNAR